MTFLAWLKRQARRADPIGALSRDLRQSPDSLRIRCYGSFRRYLLEHDAPMAVLGVAAAALREYAERERLGQTQQASTEEELCPRT